MNKTKAAMIGGGMAMGAGLGVAIGNIILGIAIGLVIGVVWAYAAKAKEDAGRSKTIASHDHER